MKIVYVEALLMDNGEVLHHGKTLGFVEVEKNMSCSDVVGDMWTVIKKLK